MKLKFKISLWALLGSLPNGVLIDSAMANNGAGSGTQIRCEKLFNPKTQESLISIKTLLTEDMSDLDKFGEAMTKGMLLNPQQVDLFTLYRQLYFGDPNTPIAGYALSNVNEILRIYPELKKPPFREYEMKELTKFYEAPESLNQHLKSQFQTVGQIRSNLFQVEANLGYWKKILNYQEPDLPQNLSKDELKIYHKKAKDHFEKFLSRLISKTNRSLLANLQSESENYQAKVKALFKTLLRIESWLSQKGKNTQMLRQAMVDLVHTAGYANPLTQVLLKSKNGLEKIEGLKRVLDERDSLAMELGYEGHFDQLQSELHILFPTGLSKNENPFHQIEKLEKEVLSSPFKVHDSLLIRVRSLSLQESPFRSCVGGSDCASRTYFSKALDPNFYYFTMTDSENNSSGHVTVVLGEAKDFQSHKTYKVAFLDKIQNVPNHSLLNFLTAVSKSLSEKGYYLGIPLAVGNHNGISNMESLRHFVEKEMLPMLSLKLSMFNPHPHKYEFKNAFSRAYDKLEMKLFDPSLFKIEAEINPGLNYEAFFAPPDLNREKMLMNFLKLKTSTDLKDLQKYVTSTSVFIELIRNHSMEFVEFEADLVKIINDKSLPEQIRKQAAFSIFMVDMNFKKWLETMALFNETETQQILTEMNQWSNSSNALKKKFGQILNEYKDKIFLDEKVENLSVFYQKLNLVFKWKNSTKESDLKKFIGIGSLSYSFEKFGLFKREEFENSLQSIFIQKKISYELRKQAFLEWLVINSERLKFSTDFSQWNENEIKDISAEVIKWENSPNARFKKFYGKVVETWTQAIYKGDLGEIQNLEKIHFFNVNSKNLSGFAAILIAAHVEQKNIIDWMLKNPQLDLQSQDSFGHNLIEQIRLLGKAELAERIEGKRPDVATQKIVVHERQEDGKPLKAFVKLPPGSFMMGDLRKIKVTITQPVEMMSTLVYQQLWVDIIKLSSQFTNSKLQNLVVYPSKYSHEDNPVENITYKEVKLWIEGLNELSNMNSEVVQKILAQLLPNHQLGDFYSLPTEAEWEYVARLRGLSEGKYLFGATLKNFGDYAWYSENSHYQTHPVGLKKPLMINGQPIYDMLGNVSQWMASREDILLRDPYPFNQGDGTEQEARGGSYFFNGPQLGTSVSISYNVSDRYSSLGFRLVRIKKPQSD